MLTPLVDMYLGGRYVTLPDVRQNPPIKITHGAKDEDNEPSPATCTFVLNDPVGDYDPGNPTGQWFGQLAENTRTRVRVPLLTDTASQTVSNGWGTADGGATWTNNTSGSSGGAVTATDWTRSGQAKTHSMPAAPGVRVSDLSTQYYDSVTRFTITLPTGALTGAAVATVVKLRTLDNNNYIGVQIIFRANESIGIGVIDRIAGTDRVLQADTEVAPLASVSGGRVAWKVAVLIEGPIVRASVWSDADPEPLDWQTSCTRATVRAGTTGIISNVATGNTNAKPFLMRYDVFSVEAAPFAGEVAEFNPDVEDESHAAPLMEITAAGIRRRVEQGSAPLKSTMFRWYSSAQRWIRQGAAESEADVGDVNTLTCDDADATDVDIGNFFRLVNSVGEHKEDQLFTVTAKSSAFGFTNIDFTPDALVPITFGDFLHSQRTATAADAPIAYWPCEEEEAATVITSGLVGGRPLNWRIGTPEFGAFDSFPGSAPILKLNNAELYADVPDYTNTSQAFTVPFLVSFPTVDEASTGQGILQLSATGDAETWALIYTAAGGGSIAVRAFNTVTGAIMFTDTWDLGMRGIPRLLVFSLAQTSPGVVTYTMTANRYPPAGGIPFIQQVAVGVSTLGKITRLQVNPGGGYVNVGFGQLAVMSADVPFFSVNELPDAMNQENVPRRFLRLSYEERVPFTYVQGPAGAPAPKMGRQKQDTLLENWKDCAELDLGRFYESRGAYSFEYRTRTSLENQPASLSVNYAGGAVLSPFKVVRDDQASRNDITVKREEGSTARAVLATGAKSVAAIGQYTDAPTIVAYRDEDLPDQAGWRLHLGTVAEDRYPTIRLTPVNGAISLEQLLSVGVGDRITVTNAVARRRYDTITQLAVGSTLELDPVVPVLELNCVPESPYHTGTLDDAGTRLDHDAASLAAGATSTATTLSVKSGDGTLWTTTPADWPFDCMVGGERVTVTAVAGASSPQTFTGVTRSVNAVVKPQTVDTPISLADPVYLSM